MIRRSLSHLLLWVFAFVTATAAAPCGAAMVHDATSVKADHGSCHHSASAAAAHGGGPAARKRGCCDPVENHPTACEKICQSLAVLRRPAALPPPERRAAAAQPIVERSPARRAAGIDHIPLA